jgi:Flp pilus assembly protein TadD
MRPLQTFSSLVLPAFLLVSPTCAQRSPQVRAPDIDVQVRNPDGSPGPPGIHIVLERAEGGVDSDCQTVQGGTCHLQPMSTGVFIVKLHASGYAEASERVELTGIPHGYVNFTLHPLNRDPGVTPAANAPGSPVDVGEVNIPEKARQEFAKGETALREKKPEDGAKHFQKAVKIYDNYPQAYRMLGEAYLEQQDWKKSEEALKKSIALDPKLAAAYVDLGAIYNQQKNYPQAEAALKKGLELSPDATAAKYELAKTYWATNRWQEAGPYARDVVNETPSLAGAHVIYANVLLKRRDAAGALREYKEYLVLEPGGPMATQVREEVQRLEKALGH